MRNKSNRSLMSKIQERSDLKSKNKIKDNRLKTKCETSQIAVLCLTSKSEAILNLKTRLKTID